MKTTQQVNNKSVCSLLHFLPWVIAADFDATYGLDEKKRFGRAALFGHSS